MCGWRMADAVRPDDIMVLTKNDGAALFSCGNLNTSSSIVPEPDRLQPELKRNRHLHLLSAGRFVPRIQDEVQCSTYWQRPVVKWQQPRDPWFARTPAILARSRPEGRRLSGRCRGGCAAASSWKKKFSTALRLEAEAGVKWKVQRGCSARQAGTLGYLWVA
jgi:hypothetical protein